MVRPLGGLFHRTEISIVGAPCGIIQRLASEIAAAAPFSVGYVDADHGAGDVTGNPFYFSYTDKITYHQLHWQDPTPEYRFRRLFHDVDALIVNGNHFKASRQVVIVNKKKEESLQRKLDRLKDVRLVILDNDIEKPFEYLEPVIQGVPVLRISETEKITSFFIDFWNDLTPRIKGLVLAGGQSTRMGHDKGAIDYHGKPQREYAADLLSEFCNEVFISARETGQFDTSYPVIEDTFTGLGPFGGILSAFRSDPNAAWFTVACDLPLMDRTSLRSLVENRNTSKTATCFHNPSTGFPEPLITIWEPRAYQNLLEFMALGYSCPRKALINSNVEEITLVSESSIANVNTPEELEDIRSRIHG